MNRVNSSFVSFWAIVLLSGLVTFIAALVKADLWSIGILALVVLLVNKFEPGNTKKWLGGIYLVLLATSGVLLVAPGWGERWYFTILVGVFVWVFGKA